MQSNQFCHYMHIWLRSTSSITENRGYLDKIKKNYQTVLLCNASFAINKMNTFLQKTCVSEIMTSFVNLPLQVIVC